MEKTIRFGVSLNSKLLGSFDKLIKEKKYTSRSEAIRDLIRENLVEYEWSAGKEETVGTINIVYDHHKRILSDVLTHIQHDYHEYIISATHVHLDHDNCFEIIMVKGKPKEMREIANKIISTKGVKYGKLTIATSGKELS